MEHPVENTLGVIDSVVRMVNRAIWIVTARHGSRRSGLVATWVASASIDSQRPLMMVGLAPNHYTCELVMASGKVGLHLLSREQLHVSFGFCLASGRVQDKFSALAVRDNGGGPPLFAECLALLDCRVVDWWDVGDRIFFAVEPFAGLNYGPGEPATEADLLAAATPDQLRLLRLNMEDDLRIQRPLREGWRASIARR